MTDEQAEVSTWGAGSAQQDSFDAGRPQETMSEETETPTEPESPSYPTKETMLLEMRHIGYTIVCDKPEPHVKLAGLKIFQEADQMLAEQSRRHGSLKRAASVAGASAMPKETGTAGTQERRFQASFHVHGEGFQVPISPHAVMSERELEELLGHIDSSGGTHREASRKEPPYAGKGKGYVVHISNQDRQIMSDKGFSGWINSIVENGAAEDCRPPLYRYKEPVYLGAL